MSANDVVAMLVERFPACFAVYEGRRKPIKIGIYHDILAAADAIDPIALKDALRFYCGNAVYLRACVEEAARIDLAGNEAGHVNGAHAAQAAQRLAKQIERKRAIKKEHRLAAEWEAVWARRRAHDPARQESAPVDPELKPELKPTRRGDGFAGLRAAARARAAARMSSQ